MRLSNWNISNHFSILKITKGSKRKLRFKFQSFGSFLKKSFHKCSQLVSFFVFHYFLYSASRWNDKTSPRLTENDVKKRNDQCFCTQHVQRRTKDNTKLDHDFKADIKVIPLSSFDAVLQFKENEVKSRELISGSKASTKPSLLKHSCPSFINLGFSHQPYS